MENELAHRLIKARSAFGWSQADLSEASGVAAAQISRYESGRNQPRPHIIAKLAKALAVSTRWLTNQSEQVDTPEVDVQELPDGSAIMLIRPNSELAEKMKKRAAMAGMTPSELLTQIVETWATEAVQELANPNARQVASGQFEKLRKRVERLEQETGIASTPAPSKVIPEKPKP